MDSLCVARQQAHRLDTRIRRWFGYVRDHGVLFGVYNRRTLTHMRLDLDLLGVVLLLGQAWLGHWLKGTQANCTVSFQMFMCLCGLDPGNLKIETIRTNT